MLAARQLTRLASLRPLAAAVAPANRRAFSSIDTAYTAVAHVSGARAGGKGQVEGSKVLNDLTFGMPKSLGGKEDPATVNPEQLFASGYSACFMSALNASYKSLFPKGEPLPEDVKLTVKASIGKPTNQQPGFQLAVEIELDHSSFSSVLPDSTDAERLLSAAHQMCPYSRATQGNIEHSLRLR